MTENLTSQTNEAELLRKSSDDEYGQDDGVLAEENGKKVVARTIAITVAIIVGVLLVLFIVSKIAQYDSMVIMLQDIGVQLSEAIRRVFA